MCIVYHQVTFGSCKTDFRGEWQDCSTWIRNAREGGDATTYHIRTVRK